MNLAGGARKVHRWTRELPTVSKDRAEVGTLPMLPHQQLEEEVARLQVLWATEATTEERSWRQEGLGTPPPDIIRKASVSFPEHAAYGPEGWHMRHYSHMGDDGLRCVGLFLTIFEMSGGMPAQLRMVMAYLVSKGSIKKGWRVINLFTSLYRLWVRIRRGAAREWELRHPRAYVAFGPGGGTIRAVYQQSLIAEAAAGKGGVVGSVLWDLREFYEHISRALLLARGRSNNFPMQLLSCLLYTSPSPRD